MWDLKRIIIVPNPNKDVGLKVTAAIAERLVSLGFECFAEKKYSSLAELGITCFEQTPETDLIVVVGGDGSVIDASRLAVEADVPLLGVNLGKVGYLSEVEPDNLRLLDKLASGDYRIDEKMLLSVAKYCEDGSIVCSERLAVNDVVFSHDNYFGISDLRLENGQGDLVSYRADGLIVATPAGSTAYSLSAGGPVVSHDIDAITVTPVCPHSFFNRSVIYGPDECLKISNSGDRALIVSVDGRFFTTLEAGEYCAICKSARRFKMLTFSENNMFTTLFNKIKIIGDNV